MGASTAARSIIGEGAQVERPVDVAAAQDQADALPRDPVALLQQGRQRGGAGAFRELVRVLVIGPHGRADLGIAHLNNPVRALQNDVERLRVGAAHGHAVGHRVGAVGRHDLPGGEGQGVGRGPGRNHSDDPRLQSERVAHRDGAADARAQSDRHIDRVEWWRCPEEFERIGSHARHQIAMEGGDHDQASLVRELRRRFPGGIEIVPRLDQFGSEGAHGCVLLDRIAVGHDDRGGDAGSGRRQRDALAVIAAGRADDARGSGRPALQAVHEDQPAAHLEGTGRRVVLVLDPGLAAGAQREQGPGILCGGRHGALHDGGSRFDLVERQHPPTLV